MPPQDNSDQTVQPSRRSVLRGAGAAGAVGIAAVAGGGFLSAGQASAATRAPAARPAGARAATVADVEHPDEPVVIYLNDAKSGEFEIFNGTKQVKVRNQRLVNELLQGLAKA